MTLATRSQVAVVGTGYSRIARRLVDIGFGALAVEAVKAAVDDAGLEIKDIDGITCYTRPAEAMPGMQDGVDFAGVDFLVRALGLRDLRWFASLDRSLIGASMIQAIHAIVSGNCNYALVYRALHNATGALAANRFTDVVATQGREFQAPYGVGAQFMGAAMTYSEYTERYRATAEHMATFIVNNRRNAAMNPNAAFYGKPINRDDYLASRVLCKELRVLDCDMPVDGVSALIITTAERARDLKQRPAYIAGYASLGTDYRGSGFGDWDTNHEATELLAKAVWRNSGLGPKDIDMASFYDGFSYFTYMWLEGFGFCKRGEAFEFIQDGRIELDGELPLNTSGGSLGCGRLHGGPQMIEAVRQVQGRCGPRQVKDARITLGLGGAPTGGVGALIYAAEPVS